jgi:hypothetical protein
MYFEPQTGLATPTLLDSEAIVSNPWPFDTLVQAQDWAQANLMMPQREALETKFASYRVKPSEYPGVRTQDYFEVELILPSAIDPQIDAARLRIEQLQALYRASQEGKATEELTTDAGMPLDFSFKDVETEIFQLDAQVSELLEQRGREVFPGGAPSHWPEENVVGHIRGQTIFDTEDKRVLFVDEMQSDWHHRI